MDDYRSVLLDDTPIIDVRAPIEFAKGSFPGAVNVPLMNDEERHLVGIEYKAHGQERAIALGAKLLPETLRQQRTAQMAEFAQTNPSAVVMCFRGGLRSRISQQWLQEAGHHLPLVKGGYKALRTFCIDQLESLSAKLNFCLIGGRTGCGKTWLLHQLPAMADLEGLACHRGSSFGRVEYAQPSNIDFENALSIALMRLRVQSSARVFLEDEARMIGSVAIPKPIRQMMLQAPLAILEAPIEQRVSNALNDYVHDLLRRYTNRDGAVAGFDAYAEHHRSSLSRVKKRLGLERFEHAMSLLNIALNKHREHNDVSYYEIFIRLLLTDYYDPMYDYQTRAKSSRIIFKGDAKAMLEWAASKPVTG